MESKIIVRTVERVLDEEGFEKLPHRTQLKIGLPVVGTAFTDKAKAVALNTIDDQRFESDAAGIVLFPPFIAQLGMDKVERDAGLPRTKLITALSYSRAQKSISSFKLHKRLAGLDAVAFLYQEFGDFDGAGRRNICFHFHSLQHHDRFA